MFYRFIRLRHRYIFTRKSRLRLRYVAGFTAITSLMFTSFLGTTTSSIAFSPSKDDVHMAQGSASKGVLSSFSSRVLSDDEDITSAGNIERKIEPLLLSSEYDQEQDVFEEVPEEEFEKILKIGSGDTIAAILQDAGVNSAEVYRVVKAMSKDYDPRSIKPGQVISVSLQPGEEGKSLKSLSMKLDPIKEVVVTMDEHERFESSIHEKDIVLRQKVASATIDTSLYGSAAQAGIPASIVAEMIRIYSYEVDFQRDLREGDTVKVLYETYETEDGDFARYGNILFANLMVRGNEIPVYRFERQDGSVDYFHENGFNLKSTLMQTPIDGARISSGYGMRKHPVLGYNKMHKGVDFAAPRGTPIFAAGDGVIEKIGRNGGYGNYIRIRHNGSLKTAYAHMHKFAKSMAQGKRVKQGQVIGYVGTTGRSTGPHLHFEVIKDGVQTNPKSIKTASLERLAGSELKRFQTQKGSFEDQYVELSGGLSLTQSKLSQ